MREFSSLLVCWLLAHAAAEPDNGFGSFFSKGFKSVAQPVGSFVAAAGNNTVGAAKSFGDGLETVGRPIGERVSSAGEAGKVAAETVGQGLQKEIQTIKHPIDTTIFYGISSQCKNVQKILGVSYEQISDKEPDFEDLKLVFKTELFTTTMSIGNAAAALRVARSYDEDSHLVVFCHGFTDDPSQTSFTSVSQAYFDGGQMSMIALDASPYISWFYLRSTTLVRFIGERLGALLHALVKEGQSPSKIHIVGHSLGAHIAGYTGKHFTELSGSKLGRITGLDPAGPCFSRLQPALRLNRTDADYVDIVHTDAGAYGISEQVGHKDYYPNRGTRQPDCLLQTCSHSRAWELYSESVLRPRAFPAVRCKDWDAFANGDCDFDNISYMGYASEPGPDDEEEGKYFLQTNTTNPFGLGQAGIKYKNMDGIIQNAADFVSG
ncbi:inactive pancreatic lipase-related protein 1 [Bicyclus anynana]|uniref:Inactive pancreatic lipase-related protein 1 n=1 Tax=Bicyclus anynana TaxID=110368 RepID=A0ABM3LZW1_BICAN|nr:inactive pancreatic lipase-related protein 1 [Bicyclus anynana]